jgi:hypothetical protein
VSVTARGATVDEWQLAPGAENHLLDTAVMAAVGASITGIEAAGAMTPGRPRRKVSMPKRPEERRRITVRRRRL